MVYIKNKKSFKIKPLKHKYNDTKRQLCFQTDLFVKGKLNKSEKKKIKAALKELIQSAEKLMQELK